MKHSMVSMRSRKQIPPIAPPIITGRLESSEPGVVGGHGKSVVIVIKQVAYTSNSLHACLQDHALI